MSTYKSAPLDTDFVRKVVADIDNEPKNVVSANAFQSVEFSKLVLNHSVLDKADHVFSHQITDEVEAVDQESAGLCWMCGGLSMCRRSVINSLGLDKDFHLSLNHLMFWDKVERSNYFLNFIIENRHLPFDSRKIDSATSHPISDGGYWHTFYDLVQKYGIVPDTVFKRRVSGKNTSSMNKLIQYKLREFASIVMSPNKPVNTPQLSLSDIQGLKNQYLATIITILVQIVGHPIYPDEKFSWTYSTKKGKKGIITDITPLEFYTQKCKINFDDYVLIMNDPRQRHPYNRTYEKITTRQMVVPDVVGKTNKVATSKLNNRAHISLNLEFDEVVKLVIKQIDAGVPVWFSCDVGKYANHKYNILDTNLYNFGSPFNTSFNNMSKADRLDFNESYASHVMCIVGYDLDGAVGHRAKKRKISKTDSNGEDSASDVYDESATKVVKFKVENSWGDIGDGDGFYLMTREWFEQYGYEVVIKDEYLTPDQIEALKTKPTKMKFTDPLGSFGECDCDSCHSQEANLTS
ncbi:Bleomycin hydrolase (pepC) [Yasminevirus sp. GU-2018]|uniref:Bleomycin hydrolase (PepC) n=1 Tax=Yasminevirus sp. GU-2018 TaxID=2420051 RepID=A0A5K0UAY9_9VIRU|nr:Bleomycin hydrolase (pepC) [Yasminevirus sp. GU-2018]